MIKFYLHWGHSSIETKDNEDFYNQISTISTNSKILIIPFAQVESTWQNKETFLEKLKKYNINFDNFRVIIASKNKLIMLIEILFSKIIFIPGWDYCLLTSHIWFLKYFKFLFHWKTIYWVSAWANILCHYSYSDEYDKIFPWLWFIDKICKCHYNELRDMDNLDNLKKYWKSDNLIKLKEKEFIFLES